MTPFMTEVIGKQTLNISRLDPTQNLCRAVPLGMFRGENVVSWHLFVALQQFGNTRFYCGKRRFVAL